MLRKVPRIPQNIITFLFAMFLIWYFISMNSYIAVMDFLERTTLQKNFILFPVLIAEAILVLHLSRKDSFRDNKYVKKLMEKIKYDLGFCRALYKILLVIIGVSAIAFVFLTKRIPRADQLEICRIAEAWRNGNFNDFAKGEYLNIYPNQAGPIIIIYFLGLIFGTRNFIAFQIINALFIVLLYDSFVKIMELERVKKTTILILLIMGCLFLPLIFYTNFIYGTIAGLALSIRSYYQFLLFRDYGKVRYALLSAFYILMAVIIKSNYMIFLIALILTAVFSLREKRILMTALLIFVLTTNGAFVKIATKGITGESLSAGASKWSWVTMGLSENDILYNGWYNGHNRISYRESNYDTEIQTEREKALIRGRFDGWKENPKEAISFFHKKNLSQWCNPTFQSIWINRVTQSEKELSAPMNFILSDKGEALFRWVWGILVNNILFLSLIYLWKMRKDINLYYALVIIGGFIFHTFWEAKCQYTLPYFMLLLPMAAEGSEYIMDSLKKTEAFVVKILSPKDSSEEDVL